MPRLPTFRNAIAAITMAVAALCGGGKALAEQKGTLSIVEVKGNAALRPNARKKASESLRDWLRVRHPDWVIRTESGDPIAIWSPDGLGDALSDLSSAEDVGFHKVAEVDQSDLREGRVAKGHIILPDAKAPDRLYAVETLAVLDASDFSDATATFNGTDRPVINYRFTPEATKRFGEWTTSLVGQRIAVVVDGKVLFAPKIREPILAASGLISVHLTEDEAARFAIRLRSTLEDVDFVVLETCPAARPRAPPTKWFAWLAPVPTCE